MKFKKENLVKSAEIIQNALQDNIAFDTERAIKVTQLLTNSYLKVCQAIELIQEEENNAR